MPSRPSYHLSGNECHLWVILPPEIGEGLEALTAAEQERAARFKVEPARIQYIRSHAAMRRILCCYTNADIENPTTGKPRFVASPLHFNLSHSHERALLAVTGACEVGADIEYIHRQTDGIDLAWWTRQEACAKASGEGIRVVRDADLQSRWEVCNLDVDPDYAAAVAAATPLRIEIRRYPFAEGDSDV